MGWTWKQEDNLAKTRTARSSAQVWCMREVNPRLGRGRSESTKPLRTVAKHQLQVLWRPTPKIRQLGCLTLPLCLTRCSSTGTTSTLWTWLSTPAAQGVPPREIPRKCGPPSNVILRPSAPIDIFWISHHFYDI